MNKILIVAAHPDDECLGCFGTVARLIKQGMEGHTLILAEGALSRDGAGVAELERLHSDCAIANDLIGINDVELLSFPDNKLDIVPLLDIVKSVSRKIESLEPDTIFTHFRNDLNIDHRITYQAVITATRPMKDCPVREIYSFEVPSATEWNFPNSFSPNVFFDITETLQLKLEAMKQYEDELRKWPHPRSIKALSVLAEYRGSQVGMQCAEAFEAVRILK